MGFVIAVDGPAASGKGTIAHRLGEAYGYPVLDSGLLYRALGQHAPAAGAVQQAGDEPGLAGRLAETGEAGRRLGCRSRCASRASMASGGSFWRIN